MTSEPNTYLEKNISLPSKGIFLLIKFMERIIMKLTFKSIIYIKHIGHLPVYS